MTTIERMAVQAACVAMVVLVGACSGANPLTTSTLLGGGATKAPDAPTPETPVDRAIFVGTTSARAQRCGYIFDPASLRQGYLASEAQLGLAPDILAKAEKSYDYTFASITKAVTANEDYCEDAQTAVIKRDLTQVLAGNYSSPDRKVTVNVGWWSATKSGQAMDREKIFNPTR